MKRREKNKRTNHKVASDGVTRRRRGRPTKAEAKESLRTDAHLLVLEFTREPLSLPVDLQFAPFYEELLKGNAEAILRYCDDNWELGNLGRSFYEFLGRLVVVRAYRIAEAILANVERRPVSEMPSERRTYEFWYKRIKPWCDRARKFIRGTHKSNAQRNRENIWTDYCFQPAWEIKTQQDKEHHEIRTRAIRDLIKAHGSAQSTFITTVNEFGSFGLVPKQIFFDLALTTISSGSRAVRFTPAHVARKYACRITGISESTASHYKNVRN